MKRYRSPVLCKTCIEEASDIFKSIFRPDLNIYDYLEWCKSYKRGEAIYHESNKPTGVYCVTKGVVKLSKVGVEGKEQIIRLAKVGDMIGYRSLLSNEPICTTAKALEETHLCFIPKDNFIYLLNNDNRFCFDMLQMACAQLRDSNAFMTDIAQKNVKERVAEILLYLTDEFGLDKEQFLNISLTREDLANMVGTATESVIRILGELKDEKILLTKGRKMAVLDEKGLRKVAGIY